MRQVLYILFGASYTVVVSWSLGKVLLRSLRVKLFRQEEHLLAFMTGSALLSLLVFLLCTAGIARKGIFLCAGILAIAATITTRSHRAAAPALPAIPRYWRAVFLVTFAVYGALYLCNSMAPEISPDGATYHLGMVAKYLRWHGFRPITTSMYANLSQGVEMLFLFAFAFGRHSAAAMVHCAFLFALPWLILSYARRFGFPGAGVCAGLLVFASPIFGIDGVSAYNDVALACIAFSVFYLLQIWLEEDSSGLLIAAGLMAGFAYATKYTAFVAVPYALGVVAWRCRQTHAPALRRLSLVVLAASILIVPWVAKNWIWLGNPVSPFLNTVFPNPFVHVSFEKSYSGYFRNYGLTNMWKLPWIVTVTGALGGLLGPVFLLTPLGLIALKRSAGRHLLIAGVVFGIPYFANIGTRFLLPVMPFLALSLALAVQFSPVLVTAIVMIHAILSWPAALRLYQAGGGWNIGEMPVRAALRQVPEETFLASHSAIYSTARKLERLVPPTGRVFSSDPVAEAYTSRDVLVSYESAEGNLEEDILLTPLFRDYQPTWHLAFSFPETKVRAIRVVQTASRGSDIWSAGELRVFRRSVELPRDPRWRLRAHPFPWDVTLAFDNSPVTRWRSWQGLFRGMFIEVDFGRDENVDEVILEASHDQYQIALNVEGRIDNGGWRQLSPAPIQTDSLPPPGLRRAAALEVKARGTSHLLIENSSALAKDFRLNQRLWGLTLLDDWGGGRLYRID